MKRNLSSLLTFYFKVIFPGIWIIGFGSGIARSFFGGGSKASLPSVFFFSVVWMIVSAILYLLCARLKTVGIDDKFLYVSNYLKEITIPLSNIYFVTEIKWINIHPVTIHLRAASEFGDKITFMPKTKLFLFGSHPVVGELKALPNVEKWDLDL